MSSLSMTHEPSTVEPPATYRSASPPRWVWLALLAALTWALLLRVPLIHNASEHLDSDLAVDGLTLIEALQGHPRLHYPGTPHMGTLPVLLSLPQAALLGASPETLVSGGAIAYLLMVVAIFWLALEACGPAVAAWSLVPLAFSSIGVLWLSSRITGGHLLTVAWSAACLALLMRWRVQPGGLQSLFLGLLGGFGLYIDRMFLPIFAVMAAAVLARSWKSLALYLLGATLGFLPHILALRQDGYDAYGEQFQTILTTPAAPGGPDRIDLAGASELARSHTGILLAGCLPRLFTGHMLPGLQTEPTLPALQGRSGFQAPPDSSPLTLLVVVLASLLSAGSFLALALSKPDEGSSRPSRSEKASSRAWLRASLLAVTAFVLLSFILNRHIYNSDNYRYLVLLLIPQAVGMGLLLNALAKRGAGGRVAAVLLAVLFAASMTWDSARWYSSLDWLSWEKQRRASTHGPVLTWLRDHPEVNAIFGDYWDVYRLAFLTGGRVKGMPYPIYPNRFPEWSRDFHAGRPDFLLVRRSGSGPFYERQALQDGARPLFESPGIALYHWPSELAEP